MVQCHIKMASHSLRLAPNICPSLTEDIYKKLKDENIHNSIDLLSRNREELAAKIRVSYKILQNICKVVNAYHGAFQVSGLDLYNNAMKSCKILSTGFEGLDKILGGGLLAEEIVEIFGCSGSGKSTFCLSLSLHIAIKEKGSVAYIDPMHSVNPAFIKEALAKLQSENDEGVEEALSRIRLFHPRDIWQLFALFEELLKEDFGSQDQDRRSMTLPVTPIRENFIENRRYRLLVLDSLPQLIFPVIGGSHFESFGVLNHLASLMSRFVQRRKAALVVVNNATKTSEKNLDSSTAKMKPVLGRYWMHVPHTRLLLERVSTSRSSEEKSCRVRITKSTRLKKDSVVIGLH